MSLSMEPRGLGGSVEVQQDRVTTTSVCYWDPRPRKNGKCGDPRNNTDTRYSYCTGANTTDTPLQFMRMCRVGWTWQQWKKVLNMQGREGTTWRRGVYTRDLAASGRKHDNTSAWKYRQPPATHPSAQSTGKILTPCLRCGGAGVCFLFLVPISAFYRFQPLFQKPRFASLQSQIANI